ncbi:hypothetical protein DFH28DRAFT_1121721 [Melampsora americana]|nr:hypothetical protein DFH28DRAFT_1121721 [Melampsora americana]
MTTTSSNLNSTQPTTNPSNPTTWEAFQGRFARVPCQRKALLFGLVGGSAIGGLRLLSNKRVRSSANWGFYSFLFLSSISFYNCSKKHEVEVQQIQTVVEKLNQLKQKELNSKVINSNESKDRDGIDLNKSENSDGSLNSNLATSSTASKKSWRFW